MFSANNEPSVDILDAFKLLINIENLRLDLNAQDKSGETVLVIAKTNQNSDLWQFLYTVNQKENGFQILWSKIAQDDQKDVVINQEICEKIGPSGKQKAE